MNAVLYGNYYQDTDKKEPIEWFPIRKYIIQNKREPQFLLISRNLLLSFKAITQWEYSYAREYLNNSFLNEAFTSEEKGKLIKFPSGDIIRIPFLVEIFDTTLRKDFYNKEILITELTAWAANGNAFELKTTYQLSNGMLQMNPAYQGLVVLSSHPSWQVLSNSTFEQISIKCNSTFYYKSNESEFYGIRPCIIIQQSTIPELEKETDSIQVEYVKESRVSQPEFPGTKIKINKTPQISSDTKPYNFNGYEPSLKLD